MIFIYNDGEVAVHLIGEDGNVGSIQRVFITKGKVIKQASRKAFLADLPVNEAFMLDIRQDEESWQMIQEAIAAALDGRGIKYTPEKWTVTQ